MSFQPGIEGPNASSATAKSEADYRYAHALYNMAERIRDRHPRASLHLEKAADAVLLAIYHEEKTQKSDDADWQPLTERRSARRLGSTFHAPARWPSPSRLQP